MPEYKYKNKVSINKINLVKADRKNMLDSVGQAKKCVGKIVKNSTT